MISSATQGDAGGVDAPRERPRILVVDDDALLRLLARESMEQDAFDVEEAPDCARALAAFQRVRPDAILLDVNLPDGDGFGVCRSLRGLRGGETTPVLMMTAGDDVAAIHCAYEAGATDFITKPINLALLGYRLRYILRAARAEAALRASEERLELALTGADAGLWDWDLSTGGVVRNRRAAEMLGYAPEELALTVEAWIALLHPDDLPPSRQAMRAHLKGETPQYVAEHRLRTKAGQWRWLVTRGRVVERDAAGRPVRVAGTHLDITAQKEAAAQVEALHRQLVDASREAGMAEVATGVLHNVGNVLNSVNVSAALIAQQVRSSKAGGVARLAGLLAEHQAALAPFLTLDPRGRTVPAYLTALGEALAAEQRAVAAELNRLATSLEHVKQVVAMQQSYAKLAGVRERIPLAALVEDALTMQAEALARHGVELVRDFAPVPPVTVDRHRVLQILMNLLNNAQYALEAGGQPDRRLTVRIAPADGAGVAVAVTDNGVGIRAEDLTQIFSHGFTTRRDGHGFGLHSGALAAREMGGHLTAHSDGLGAGATFTLTLPLTPKETTP